MKKSRTPARLGAFGVLLAMVLLSSPAWGQNQTTVFGTYHYTKSFDHGRNIIHGAFEGPIKSIPFIFRPLVRSRIHGSNLMIRSFDISRAGPNIVFRALEPTTWTWDLTPGVPEQVRTPTGNLAQMTHQLRGRTYVQTFRGKKTHQRLVYVLSPTGERMRVGFRIKVSFADEPVEFSLLYRRANPRS